MDSVCAALEVSRCSILLFDENGVMRFHAWRGLSDEYRLAVEGHSPWPFGARDVVPITIRDVDDDADLMPFRAALDAEHIRSLAFVPLRHDRDLIGKVHGLRLRGEDLRRGRDEARRDDRMAGGQRRRTLARRGRTGRRAHGRRGREPDQGRVPRRHLPRAAHPALVDRGRRRCCPQGRPNDPLITKGLEVIARNATAQARIIDDILDASPSSPGSWCSTVAPGCVRDRRERGRRDPTGRAEQESDADIHLGRRASSIPLMAVGDAERLRQVFSNVLANAVKFTPAGGTVTVRVARRSSFINVTVTDTGEGIAPEFLPAGVRALSSSEQLLGRVSTAGSGSAWRSSSTSSMPTADCACRQRRPANGTPSRFRFRDRLHRPPSKKISTQT